MSIIGFGRWNFYYYYILISTITKFIKEDILGLGSDFQIIFELKITHHPVIILLIGFSSDLIIGLIFILYSYHKEKNNNDTNAIINNIFPILPHSTTNREVIELNKEEKNDSIFINTIKEEKEKEENERIMTVTSRYSLIHNDLAEIKIDILKQNTMKFILLCSFLIVVKEFFTAVAYNSNDIFDYYFLNLIIISIILIAVFKQKLYNHQIFAIIFVSIISGTCLISCLVYLGENTKIGFENNSFSFNFKDKYYLIIILVIVYIIISILFCMGIIIQKNLMVIKFIATYKILFWKGLLGVISCFIGLIITSNVPCDIDLPPPPDSGQRPPGPGLGPGPGPGPGPVSNNTLDLFQIFVCSDSYKNKSYFDNFFSYFEHLTNEFERPFNNINDTRVSIEDKYDLNTRIVIEVFMVLGYFILHYISEIYLIMINNNLSPIHYLITESLFNLIHIPYQMIARIVEEKSKNERIMDEYEYIEKVYNLHTKTLTTRILKLGAVFVELLGYLIYMEIIHLNFCGLNRNIEKNIDLRAKLDALVDEDDQSMSNNSEDGDYNIYNVNDESGIN